ncbi:MAG TPA: ribosome silencing factor [Anaerolineales bacterium]|nr:ribosome silencing factor [Anaerolineales bacterium]
MEVLEDKLAEDILLLDIREISDFTDYFIITSGTSDRMLNALADAVREAVKARFERIGNREGEAREGWIVEDFGDIVVHFFSPDRRDYYRLEELWSKGRVIVRLQ